MRLYAAAELSMEPLDHVRRSQRLPLLLGKRKNVRSSSPPSRKLVTTPGQRLAHMRSNAVYAPRAVSVLAA
jgi:hypothetical protein